MKKRLLIISFLVSLAAVPIGYAVAGCTGNSTHEFIELGNYTQWCCTPVGEGWDFSCTDGTEWHLFSDMIADGKTGVLQRLPTTQPVDP